MVVKAEAEEGDDEPTVSQRCCRPCLSSLRVLASQPDLGLTASEFARLKLEADRFNIKVSEYYSILRRKLMSIAFHSAECSVEKKTSLSLRTAVSRYVFRKFRVLFLLQ